MAGTKTESEWPPEYYESHVPDLSEAAQAKLAAKYSPGFLDQYMKRIDEVQEKFRKREPGIQHVASPNGYRTVNKLLRGQKLMKRDMPKAATTIKLLDEGFVDPASRIKEACTVWRGVGPRLAADLDKAYAARDPHFADVGYVMVSKQERPLAAIMEIRLPAGTPLLDMGSYLDGSALLPHGSVFKLDHIVEQPGRRTYVCTWLKGE